jgi:hypothetical protein
MCNTLRRPSVAHFLKSLPTMNVDLYSCERQEYSRSDIRSCEIFARQKREGVLLLCTMHEIHSNFPFIGPGLTLLPTTRTEIVEAILDIRIQALFLREKACRRHAHVRFDSFGLCLYSRAASFKRAKLIQLLNSRTLHAIGIQQRLHPVHPRF